MKRLGMNYQIATHANVSGLERMGQAMARMGRVLRKQLALENKHAVAQVKASKSLKQVEGNLRRTSNAYKNMRKVVYATYKALWLLDTVLKKQIGRSTTLGIVLKGLGMGFRTAKRGARAFGGALGRVSRLAKRARGDLRDLLLVSKGSATFLQRIASAMVIFGAGRAAAQGFAGLVKTSVEFNRNLETAQLGIAALITSSGVLVDSQNRIVSVTEKFAWAQARAAQQTRLLRRDALATEATFQELLSTYQIAISPGLSGGLDLNEIRQFTIRISQAATALQMPQRQMAEEVRSILQGTIKLQNTRIAAALELDNAEIKKWREQNILAEKLLERFKSFQEAGKLLKDTFTGLAGRIRDSFQQMAGEAGAGFFQDLKNGMKEVLDLMVTFTSEGVIFKPEALLLFKEVFNSVQGVFRDMVKNIKSLSFQDIYTAVQGIVKGFQFIAEIIIGVGRGLSYVVRDLGRVGDFVKEIAKSVGILDEGRVSLADMVAKITELLMVWTLFSAASKITLTTFSTILGAMKALRTVVFGLLSQLTPMKIIVMGFAAILFKVAKVLNKEISKELGIGADFITQMAVGLKIAWNVAKLITQTLVLGFKMAGTVFSVMIDSTVIGLIAASKWAIRAAAEVAKTIGADKKYAAMLDLVDRMDMTQARAEKRAKKNAGEGLQKLGKAWGKLKSDWASFKWDAGVDDLLTKVEKAGGGLGFLKNLVKGLFSGDLFGGGDSALAKQQKLLDSIAQVEEEQRVKREKEQKALEAAQAKEMAIKKVIRALEATGAYKISQQIKEYKKLEADLAELIKRKNDNGVYKDEAAYNADVAQAVQLLNEKAMAIINVVKAQKLLDIETSKAGQLNAVFEAEKAVNDALEAQHLKTLERVGGTINAMKQGLLSFAYETQTVFQGISETITNVITQLADTISNTIVDAFDPTKDVDLKERFGRFLQDISRMMIQTFLKIAMAKAVMGIFGGPGAGIGSALTGSGFNQGGLMKGAANASPAHYLAPQGLARGGRPRNLHPSDTIPIWAAKGEFMMRVAAVRKYGAETMAKINAGLVDPAGLAGLAGTTQAISRRVSGGPGYAEGGEVTPQTAVGVKSSTDQITRSYIVADDESLDQLLSGGRSAFVRFLRTHKDEINGSLK